LSKKASKLVFRNPQAGGLDPLGPEDNLRRLDFYNSVQRKNAWGSPAPAFVVGVLFVGLGIWILLSGPTYLGYGLLSIGIGGFFALVAAIMLWGEARQQKAKKSTSEKL
jgi:hypothetical protein